MNDMLRTMMPVVLIALIVSAVTADEPKSKADKDAKPQAAEAKPADKPADAKPAEVKAAEAKPAEVKPADKPADAKPAEAKPAPKAEEAVRVADEENSCIQCHANLTEKDQKRLCVTAKDFAADIHWQKGLRCQDCHGGDPTVFEIKAHQAKENFRTVKSPVDIPEFCAHCHSDIQYMRHYSPSPRTDQLAEYLTSGHGKQLKTGDTKVATCISCHDQPHGTSEKTDKHEILAVTNPLSPVYRNRIAKTCSKCHSDQTLMAGRKYHGVQLAGDEYAKWSRSVHGKAMMEKGDLSAPTCNNCHGNHGALPPQVDSIANACGACHGKIAKFFNETRMKHKFESSNLPGCATCHSNHEIMKPSDTFVGMEPGSFCIRCHEKDKPGKFGATIAGADVAKTLRRDLEHLKGGITSADEKLVEAERLGMEVSEAKFNLRKATDSLTNARTLIHTFQVSPVEKALAEGEKIVTTANEKADNALEQHRYRRIWLGVSLVPIFLAIGVLLLYIRSLPA